MRIDKLISELEHAKRLYGNIEVVQEANLGGDDFMSTIERWGLTMKDFNEEGKALLLTWKMG